MLDYYITNIHPTENLIIFADNCSSQNKNNSMIDFSKYLEDVGRCKYVELNFLLTRHTKFSPDRLFGVFDAKYAVTNIDCFSDIIQCVISSSRKGYNILVPIRSPSEKSPKVVWRQYDKTLQTMYVPLKGILKIHDFIFGSQTAVECKEFVYSQLQCFEIKIPHSFIVKIDDIETISPADLSNERQWYLYKQIRVLCIDDSKMNKIAPEPTVPRKKKKGTIDDTVNNVIESKYKKLLNTYLNITVNK